MNSTARVIALVVTASAGFTLTAGGPVAVSATRESEIVRDSELADEIHVSAARPIDSAGTVGLVSLALVATRDNSVHVFASSRADSPKVDLPPSVIEHRILRGESFEALEGSDAVERPILFVLAREGYDGRLYLCWVEDMAYYPDAHPSRAYLSEWGSSGWSRPQQITDPSARPGVTFPDGMDLVVHRDGTLEALWIDWREVHFLKTVFGDEGDYPKVYFRRRVGGTWGQPKRVQPRGSFSVGGLSAVEDAAGTTHLFWRETRGPGSPRGYAHVLQASGTGGSWGKATRMYSGRNFDGTPSALQHVTGARGQGDALLLAWISTRWLNDSRKEESASFRAYSSGRWSETVTVASGRVADISWCGGPGGTSGLLVRSSGEAGIAEGGEIRWTLSFLPIANRVGTAMTVVANDVAPQSASCAVTPDGVTHIVYVAHVAEGKSGLVYRRLTTSRSLLGAPSR